MADGRVEVLQAFEKGALSLQDGMHTPNINCCRTLFFPTSRLLFIPLWQSWMCLLGSTDAKPQWADGLQMLHLQHPLQPHAQHRPASSVTIPDKGTESAQVCQCSTLLHSGVTPQIGESLRTALLSETPLPHPFLSLHSSQMAELHEVLLAHFCSRFFIGYLCFPIKSSHTSILTSAS